MSRDSSLFSLTVRLAYTAALAAAVAACSLTTQDRDPCTSNAQCVGAFGPGSVCLPDGFCRAGDGGFALADTCQVTGDVPIVESSPESFRIDTGGLSNFISELSSCSSFDAPGNDGFLAIDMEAGEKWHFHASVIPGVSTPGANPTLYVLPSCDARTCQPGDAIDECDDGSDEHLTFVPATTSRYFIAIDSRTPGGTPLDLLAIAPVCGNGGMPEHSETCDDGNTDPGDGCDEACRIELADNGLEVEPNDDFTGANAVIIPGEVGAVTARASLGGRCDYDMFAIRIPDSGSIEAEMFNATGMPCGAGAPEVTMQLFGPDGRLALGSGEVFAPNQCPSIAPQHPFAIDLPGGTYYVRVNTFESAPLFNYQIRLTARMP